jgi:beta-lactam-binding protein with PASTA domain
MLVTILVLAAVAIAVFFLMKKGKIADANGNNIPDAVEKAAAEAKEEMEEVIAKVKKTTAKKKTTKKKNA